MINTKEERSQYFGTTILVVLFLLMSVALHHYSLKSGFSPINNHQITSTVTPAVVSNNPSGNCSHKNFVSLTDKISYRFFNENLRVKIFDGLIHQKIGSLFKIEQQIKPLISERFYCLLCLISSDTLPVLS